MVTCSVSDCSVNHMNNPEKYTFHRFPQDPLIRGKWLKLIGRVGWNPKKNSTICSKHFIENFKRKIRINTILVKGAIPTLFVPIRMLKMDDENSKVFSSSIIRSMRRSVNNYKDLLQVEPATPIVTNNINIKSCNYEPKTDKFYVRKKKNGAKVKTVRDIRSILEKDVYSYLLNDLELKQNYLIRKIKIGCLKDPKLQSTAKKILASDAPMSRTVWRILMNINPDGKIHPTQFVFWNGNNIKVNGSTGGNNKFLHRFYASKTKKNTAQGNRKASTVNVLNQKKSLLQSSLHVKFKPGPLTKKKFLATTYQKHDFHDLEVVTLPKPGLEVQPTYGKFIPPTISTFIYQSFTNNLNVLSENWANFAVSVLGTSVNGSAVQSKEDCTKTYDLNYNCSQNRLLMQRDYEKGYGKIFTRNEIETNQTVSEELINFDVKRVLNDILGAVEISLEQDKMYSGEDDVRESSYEEKPVLNIQPKDNKAKKRYICELDRLDVTVIRIPENTDSKPNTCSNSYCNLGCVCDSLSCNYNIKGHCGRFECMFRCTCDFSGYHIGEFLERNNCTSYLPEIVSKEKTCDLKLAKEEKKFHQTVIVTEDKSIVLKPRKRYCKSSKKYASFYGNMRLKNEKCIDKELYVMVDKLNLKNVEPFCLVHNLYRCFCDGKFTNTTIEPLEEIKNSVQVETELFSSDVAKTVNLDSSTINADKPQSNQERTVRSLRIKTRLATQTTPSKAIDLSEEILVETCARTEPYGGRKYSNGYYLATNVKIKEMEMNDTKLQKKLNEMINHTETNSLLKNTECLKDNSKLIKVNRNKNRASLFGKPVAIEENVTEVDSSSDSTIAVADTRSDISKTLQNKFSNKSKLISWLETSYKQYKRKAELGNINLCLGPPQPGKMALYPWDFILSRYRERKNYFLITKTKPYRLFMTVNENNQFFASSTNINNIPWSEIDKYPVTVRNLLTNATDIRDNFFILFGLTHSWELVGSVTKINESISSADVNLSDCQSNESYNEVLRLENILNSSKPSAATTSNKEMSTNSQKHNVEEKTKESGSDSSKWFVMTIENDFSEIQFFNKGFFVKYESVMKAINVSRASKKTVRLSSQKCNSQQSDPQFGIYAIPSENDSCVFIGPYEKDEELGIETINTTTDPTRKRTRGIWITTAKVDNLRVIDNPLSFMPTNSNISNAIPLYSHFNTPNIKGNDDVYSDQQKKRKKVIKTLKPIRIGKTNGFYHLASDGLFHQISPEKSPLKTSNIVVTLQGHNDKLSESSSFNESENRMQSENHGIFSKKLINKPIAEIAPQVKSTTNQMPVKRKLEGMFILKPEEINQRSFEGTIRTIPTEDNLVTSITNNIIINNDIEKFLASSTITKPPNEEICIISDEEDVSESRYDFKYQYIICKNIKSLGWIHGRRDSENRLSFEFPGFKETEFYPEHEAFEKINQVFSRKVYVPKNITLEWCTVDDLSQIEERQKLESHELNADYIMTKKGLCHKSDIIKNIKSSRRSTETTESDVEKCLSSDSVKLEFNEMKNALLKELEETSAQLEDESDILLTETLSRKETFLDTLGSMSENARRYFSEKLQEMYSSPEELSSDT